MTRFYRLDLQVVYSAPVAFSRRVLRVLPLARPNQSARNLRLQIAPKPASQSEKVEKYGTRALILAHRKIDRSFDFRLEFKGQTQAEPLSETGASGVWKMPSYGVDFGGELGEIAPSFREFSPAIRAQKIAEFCATNLNYTPQNSPAPPRASQVWVNKIGSCAEFTHVFLALARQSGLPARYVSGFGLQSGALHAWAEVFCEGAWKSFDPTLGRELSLGCFAVALGRDFADCAPHFGSFRGTASAEIQVFCSNESE